MMSLSTQETEEDSQYDLVAKLDNARIMANILKAINFKPITHAIVFASERGLKVTVEHAKCVQANAFLQTELFQQFYVKDEICFKVNLCYLLDCLNIFGSNQEPGIQTALELRYRGYGYPLTLLLEDNGVMTDCSIKTQEPEETLDFDFCSPNVINQIIMKSEALKEAFSELDMTSEILQILMSPDKPYLRLSTFGDAGSTHSDFERDSDLVEGFQCKQTQTNRYKVSLIKASVKALMISSRVSIRTDRRGFLSLQYMIKTESGQTCFVEHFVSPDEEVEQEEEEEPADCSNDEN